MYRLNRVERRRVLAVLPDACSFSRADKFWHSGAPGLRAGDILVPASHTGDDPRQEKDSNPCRLAGVFFSSDDYVAYIYAASYPDRMGALYRVRPIGKVKRDPIGCESDFCCSRAKIVEVVGQPWSAPATAWFYTDAEIHKAVRRVLDTNWMKSGFDEALDSLRELSPQLHAKLLEPYMDQSSAAAVQAVSKV